MFNRIDLSDLANRHGPTRSFLSLYRSSPQAKLNLDAEITRVRELLSDAPTELEHFEQNLSLIETYLSENPHESGSLCMFACWADDYLHVFPLQGVEDAVPDLLRVDSSPYIRPLAELQDEYENYVVVTADNSETRVYLVTSASPTEAERVEGDIKNAVKKGGWSQQRYARRREKDLLHYAKEVAEVLTDLAERETFKRLFLVGSDEAMLEIENALPLALTEKLVGRQAVDLYQEDETWEAVWAMFERQEREDERDLWDRVKGEYLRGGAAAAGSQEVLEAAAVGRVEHMIVTRDAAETGVRCRDCQNLSAGEPERCPVCGSDSVFEVDLVNELVELVAAGDGETEFADPIPGLSEFGDVAALLRY